jgi:hypothetical protein
MNSQEKKEIALTEGQPSVRGLKYSIDGSRRKNGEEGKPQEPFEEY